jgi:hypothetical protein
MPFSINEKSFSVDEREGALMNERVQAIMSSDDLQRLDLLAQENAGENRSLMLRKLIRLAYENPELLGLHTPKQTR